MESNHSRYLGSECYFRDFSRSCWDKFLDLALFRIGWGQQDMEIKLWWLVPENFTFPLEFYIEEDQEELLFGPLDSDLARVEAHNQTLIQLETRLTATSLTCVLLWGWLS
eukprot:bmy_02052T0